MGASTRAICRERCGAVLMMGDVAQSVEGSMVIFQTVAIADRTPDGPGRDHQRQADQADDEQCCHRRVRLLVTSVS